MAKSPQIITLFAFMRQCICRLRQHGRVRTSETYTAALNSFSTYRHGADLTFPAIKTEIMEGYQAWLRTRGLSPNTISFYNRILRAVYNRAVESGLTADSRPFRHVYTGIGKTVKRALPVELLIRIKCMDLRHIPSADYARDMFMLSFYLRGMSFVDMAFLRKSDLRDGHVVYRRRKTGQPLSIEWTAEMQAIIDKYPDIHSEYLLPVIRRGNINERSAYKNAGYNINRSLKKMGEQLGLRLPLTLYVARHSWASAAQSEGVPLGVISRGMGHNSESTTRIYLSAIDSAVIDHANALIIKALQPGRK